MVSDFRCNLELALCETPDVELVTWDQSKDTWFRVTIPNQRHRTARVAPDAYFVLRERGELRYFFLEVDRGTEEHRRVIEKFTAYWWYLQHPRFTAARGDRPRVNVLFVTRTEKRSVHLHQSLRSMQTPNRPRHAGRGVFRFMVAREERRALGSQEGVAWIVENFDRESPQGPLVQAV